MTETVVFDASKSKHILLPQFTAIALSDEEPIAIALDIILRAKNRSISSTERDTLINQISSFVQGDNIGCLRRLQDSKWKQMDIPLIFRIYLKQLIMESHALTPQQILECDFNYGLQYDSIAIKHKITQLLSLGFSRNEALEAIMVTNNDNNDNNESLSESNGVEIAAQYLLSDDKTRKMEYQRAKKQRNQNVSPNDHWTIIEYKTRYEHDTIKWQKKSENELLFEIQKLKEKLNLLRKRRIDLEKKRDEIVKSSKLILYKEYIRGIVADHKINAEELGHIERYKLQRKISKEDDINTLKNLGIAHEDEFKSLYDGDFELIGYNDYELIVFGFCRKYYLNKYYNMQTYQFPDGIVPLIIDYVMIKLIFDKYFSYYYDQYDDECVVCYEPPRDYMMIPCFHVCLNSSCAEENFPAPHDGQKCPLCSMDVQNVKQIYYY